MVNGTLLQELNGATKHLQEPYGLAVLTSDSSLNANPDSLILVADRGANCIYTQNINGFVESSMKSHDMTQPLFECAKYLCVSGDGNIIFTDATRKIVKMLNLRGQTLWKYPSPG